MEKSFMTDLNRLMARQNFKDEKELQAFFDNLTNQSLYDLPLMELTFEEQAQDLVFEAFKLTPDKAKKNIEKALALDPTCIEAYEYLASREKKLEKALAVLEKGIAIGREKFGGQFLKKNKGIFWGIHETRPFMRCLYAKSEILVLMGKIAEGVAIMEEMLEINKNDNQGVRYPLLSALIVLGETEKFKKYDKMFDDDASAQTLYSRALFTFKTEGNSANARKMLNKAFQANPFVVQMLLEENPQFQEIENYSLGSREEAQVYLVYACVAWCKTEDAIEWLMDVVEKILDRQNCN